MIRERSPVHAHENQTSPQRNLAENTLQQQHPPPPSTCLFQISQGEVGEESKRRTGGRVISLSLLFSSALPFLHNFFFSGRVEIQESCTKYFSYFKLLHFAFFGKVTKAFSSKGDEIPLIIAL